MAINEFFHLIHIVDDEDEVDAWYDAVFAPQRFMEKGWFDLEKRWASLSMIGDFMIEVIEPSGEPDDLGVPLPKFRSRFGQHFHSLAWYTDEGGIKPLFDRVRAMGIRVAKPGGGMWPPDGDVDPGPTIFTHPKDTFGQLEFVDVAEHWKDTDPRFQPGWSPTWNRNHPLGIQRVSHLTTIVTDLDRATALYEQALEGRVLHRSSTADRESVFVFVGSETIVELAKPTSTTGRLAEDFQANGELPHACTFTVADLDAVERHMATVGVGIAERAGDSLTLDPADCFNAVYVFTTSSIPGDPRTTG